VSATDDMLESIAEMIEYAREKAAYGKTYSPVHKVALEIRELQQLLRFRGRSIKYHSFGDAILSSPLHEMEAQLSPRERQIASLTVYAQNQATNLGLVLFGCAITEPNKLRQVADALEAEQNTSGPWRRLIDSYESALESGIARYMKSRCCPSSDGKLKWCLPFPTLTEVRTQFRQMFGQDSWHLNEPERDRTMRKTCHVLGLQLCREKRGRKPN